MPSLTDKPATYIPQDDATRKRAPMFRGLLGFFPAALFEVAAHSLANDAKHGPADPHAPTLKQGVSPDTEDCIVRHLIDAGVRGTPNRRYHLRALAWRALRLLQEDCEADGALPGCHSRPAPSAPAEVQGPPFAPATFGIFLVRTGTRSENYPDTYPSREAAEGAFPRDFLGAVPHRACYEIWELP